MNFDIKNFIKNVGIFLAVIVALFCISFLTYKFSPQPQPAAPTEQKSVEYVSDISYEQAIMNTVKAANDSVVSIIISKNLPTYEQKWINPFGDGSYFDIQIPQYVQNGTEYKEVGSGSGFIVSADGLVLTNKHVVIDKDADYSVVMNDGQKYSAQVLATDPVQDLAIIKIKNEDGKTFVPLVLGNSDGIQLGQTAIAIGNALGEFSNTVSVGIVSGLSRTISASDELGANTETLEDIIQTDAAINSGNSGGPLMNLKGEVIGINTAIAQDAENIAFAIPINYAKKDIDQVKTTNKISYPFLGIRYVLVDENVKKAYELSVDYGAYISSGAGKVEPVTKDSPAEKAGLKEGDVILEFNGEKIIGANTLAKIMQKYSVGDTVSLKVLRGADEFEVQVQLAERQD
jgi:serine protease Do